MAASSIRALLEASGYELRFHTHAWVECLATREGEAWKGSGASEDAALDAVVRQAFPSAIARALLAQALELPAGSEPAMEASPSPSVSSAPRAPDRNNGRVAPSSPSSRAGPPPLVRREAVPPTPDMDRSVEELAHVMSRIQESRDELGMSAPERQRLAIYSWICEARAHTDTFPDASKIRDEVASISRALTEIGKAFWPGSVTALQLQMLPKDLPRHLLGGTPSSWSRAAELAERALMALEYNDERRGHDAYGWADVNALSPRPANPAAELLALREEVEAASGPVDRGAEPRDAHYRPDPITLRLWIRKLRWLRGAEVEPELWARLAGRFRWWASRRDAPLASAARELDPGYVPTQPWAAELEVAEEARTSEAAGPPTELAAQVDALVSGKRLVVVSHRRDPELSGQLEQVLGSASLEWRVAEPKRLEELGAAIARGEYDIVLGAIGLQAQSTDHLLAHACSKGGVRYVRVNRGRPSTCLRGLAR